MQTSGVSSGLPGNAELSASRPALRGEYGKRTLILLLAWIIGYGGLVCAFTGYLPVLLSKHGMSSSQTFGALLTVSIGGGCLGLVICSAVGERVERRTSIFSAAVAFGAAMYLLYFFHSNSSPKSVPDNSLQRVCCLGALTACVDTAVGSTAGPVWVLGGCVVCGRG